MKRTYTLRRWVAIGFPLWLAIAAVIALLVHVSFGIAWKNLVVPVSLLAVLQVGVYVAMFWLRWTPRPATLLSGAYCLAVAELGVYYAAKWKLIAAAPFMGLAIFAIAATAVAMVVISFIPWKPRA